MSIKFPHIKYNGLYSLREELRKPCASRPETIKICVIDICNKVNDFENTLNKNTNHVKLRIKYILRCCYSFYLDK
jgi:hypothetical protein